jgi:hypothetical protein
VRAMSALVSTSGSSTIGSCIDQRHRLRRIAQRQASGTQRFVQCCTSSGIAKSKLVLTQVMIGWTHQRSSGYLYIPLGGASATPWSENQAMQRVLIPVTPGSKLVTFSGNLQVIGNHPRPPLCRNSI